MTDAQIAAMKEADQTEFRAALTDRGTVPGRFDLLVHIDELVGPMAFVVEDGGEKRHWPLPALQVWLERS